MNLNFYRLSKVENYLKVEILKEIVEDDTFLNFIAGIIKNGNINLLHIKNFVLSTKKFLKILCFLKLICAELNTILVIEDRIDVANVASLDGIFLPNNSFSVTSARQFCGQEKILGFEISNNLEEIISENEKIDYFIINDSNFDADLLKNKICFYKKEIKPCLVGNLVYLSRTSQ